MIVVSVMYPSGEGKHFDMDYYCNTHLAIVKEAVGDALKSVTVERGLSGGAPGSPAEYTTVCHLQFDSLEDFQTYMAPHSPAFNADIVNFTNIAPLFQISEVVA